MTAPWLATDGRPWFERRRPVTSAYDKSEFMKRSYVRRTRTYLAAQLYCATLRTAPFSKSQLWSADWAPWEF